MKYEIIYAGWDKLQGRYVTGRVSKSSFEAAASAKWSMMRAGYSAKIKVKFEPENDLPKAKERK